ncbi:unnamed protein product [Brassica oleracea var. botrytis]|uniref:(rape) hypothetical protein n=1 Tax=Brassica napus TaxID=3708 RepID=A0A816JQD7_BRANA|nr:unnamed protein product [Brassica napus]
MGYFELSVFSFEITRGLLKAGDMKKIKRARPVNKEPISPVARFLARDIKRVGIVLFNKESLCDYICSTVNFEKVEDAGLQR